MSHQAKLIPLHLIIESAVAIRTNYDDESIKELADSVEEGLLSPIVVAPAVKGKYELIIGSRRLRAARLKRAENIPAAVIEKKTPFDHLLMALTENIHRKDLNPFEEGQVFLRLARDYGLHPKEIAKRMKKTLTFVRQRLELLDLPAEVKRLIADQELGLQFVSPIANVPDKKEQIKIAEQIVKNDLTANEARVLIEEKRLESRPLVPRSPTTRPKSSRPIRQKSVTVEKIRFKVDVFSDWLANVPQKMRSEGFNNQERRRVLQSFEKLSCEVEKIKKLLSDRVWMKYMQANATSNLLDEGSRNYGQEWSSTEIRKIMAANRSSDEELANELGRTPNSIKTMRQKILSQGKHKKAS
jgi:ParB family chromosome partitioning protein